ncbi:MAG: alcohol dehydrogenase catalytic domain-containing protein [Chitinophagaceae bacterium]|nr:alcohol dehydrogenase catalytic domain-containing protein [Chitinophagaceae bacterium]
MKALYYPANDELLLTELPVPVCQPNEVLIEVKACGICGSELETFKTRSLRRIPPLIMGHEFCGVIDRTGADVKGWKQGDAVVSNSVVFCGECNSCKEGKTNLCSRRQVFGMHRNGAFGAYVNVPASSLIAMPSGASFRAACLTEPMANGVHLVKLTKHLSIKNTLVIGAGPIGLAAQQAFSAMRNVVTVVSDIRPDRLEVAERIGATAVINPLKEDVFESVKSITQGAPLDLVVDAVGSAETNKLALDIVKPGGTVLMIGLYNNSKSLLSYDIVLSEKTVMGSYAATQQDMEEALALITDGKVDVTSWIHYYTLENGRQAFFDMMEAKDHHIKSVIVFE